MSDQIKGEELRQTEAKKILDEINDSYGISKIAELIKDNKIEFEYEGNQYRVRLLTIKERDDLDYLRRTYFGKLMQDKNILLEKNLIEIYEERGIKISELDSGIAKIQKKIQDANYKLGEALANKAGDNALKMYREEIEGLTNEVYEILIQKSHLLEFSLEQQLANYVAKITAWLSLDIKEGEIYKRTYQNLDDYLQAPEKLINLSAAYSQILQNKI